MRTIEELLQDANEWDESIPMRPGEEHPIKNLVREAYMAGQIEELEKAINAKILAKKEE